MANISIKRGSNGSVTITRDSINPYSISGPVNLQQITGGVSIHPHNTSGLTFEQSKLTILASDTLTVNDASYTPADAAALHTKLRDEVFFLVNKQNKTVLVSNVALSHTGSTTETIIYTGTIPANSIGVNGSFIATFLSSTTNSAGTKMFRMKFNATTVYSYTPTTSIAQRSQAQITNRNSLSAQIAGPIAVTGFGVAASNAVQTFAINTAADITVTITIQLSSGTDIATLESLQIVAIP